MTVKRLVGMTPKNEREQRGPDVSESGRITFTALPLPEPWAPFWERTRMVGIGCVVVLGALLVMWQVLCTCLW